MSKLTLYGIFHCATVAVCFSALQYVSQGQVNVDVVGGYIIGATCCLMFMPDSVRRAE